MVVLMEDITLEIELHKRFYNQVFIGLPFLTMQESLFYLVMNVKELVNISRHNEIPMNYSPVIEPFDCWEFDFMGPFPPSKGYTHILVAVDYVTKWVEAIPTKSADGETSLKMLKDAIFPRFGVPRYLMTDGGSNFIHNGFRKTLAKYDVNHRIARSEERRVGKECRL